MTTPTPTVSEDDFTMATTAATAIRVHRYVLWQLAPKSSCCVYDDDEDPPMIWHRCGASADIDRLLRTIYKTERFDEADRYAWLITEEHHDVLGNFYTPAGDPILSTWQPTGPALLRTADNPSHWIPIERLIPWHFMAPIAVSSAACPADWNQPRKPHYLEEDNVWVHFTDTHGPFEMRWVLSKFQAPRHPTEPMRAFLADKHFTETPSAADMTSAILAHISVNKLMPSGPAQTVYPDAKLTALLGSSDPFPMSDLQSRLQPLYGPHI
jgi:hypothetical protein